MDDPNSKYRFKSKSHQFSSFLDLIQKDLPLKNLKFDKIQILVNYLYCSFE